MKKTKISIPNHTYEAMFESEIVKSGNGAVAKAYKKYLNYEVVILVKEKNEKEKLVDKIVSDNEVAVIWEENEN